MEYRSLLRGEELSIEGAKFLFHAIIRGELLPTQIAAVLGVLAARGVTVPELIGAHQAVREECILPEYRFPDAFDVCGTGGDGKNTFNISTCAAFAIAGTGSRIIKNGNYSASSGCGSSNVLEELGVTFPASQTELEKLLDTKTPIFIHAPVWYPTLKVVASIRKELGIRTVFNLLGPLLNPVIVGTQLVGVTDRSTVRTYSEVLRRSSKNFAVVHSLDGYDEVSLTAPVQVISHKGNYQFSPSDFGFKELRPDEIALCGGVKESADIIRNVVSNSATLAQKNVVIANAALALWCATSTDVMEECVGLATKSIESGAASHALKQAIGS